MSARRGWWGGVSPASQAASPFWSLCTCLPAALMEGVGGRGESCLSSSESLLVTALACLPP